MPPKRRRRRRKQRPQAGEGINAVIAGIPKTAWSITKGIEKLAKKNARKAHFETHGRDQKWETKTLCGGIVYVQPHVSIKRKQGCEKQTNKHAKDKSASNETKKKATRGFIPTGRSHSCLDRWRKSRGVWCAGGAASYGAKKGWKPLFGKNDDDGIKRDECCDTNQT